MKIAGLQRVTLIDYPGRVAATVFLAGCNLRCGYCHNRWMLDASHVPEALTVADLLAWLKTRRKLLDGVCISGGEPTLEEDLPSLLRAIKDLGFLVKLDTNGTLPERLRAILEQGFVDYVALDVKAPLDERYADIVGVSLAPETVRRSMELLAAWGGDYELRTTVAPGLDEQALIAMAATVDAIVTPAPRWFLQPFEPTPEVVAEVRTAEHLPPQALEALLPRLRALMPRVELRI